MLITKNVLRKIIFNGIILKNLFLSLIFSPLDCFMNTIENYNASINSVSYSGVTINDNKEFIEFVKNDVVPRLNDQEGQDEFEKCLQGIASTGFANNNLEVILSSVIPECRGWAICESIAEVWLSQKYNVVWPWNMHRDARNPQGSLPGADLVGFVTDANGVTQFVFGEVKSSSEKQYPPQVMSGRSGMVQQIDTLASDLKILHQLIFWLFHRCKEKQYHQLFTDSMKYYIESGNKAVSLYGVLIRDTVANNLDLEPRGKALSKKIQAPTKCDLLALYLPCAINELQSITSGGES